MTSCKNHKNSKKWGNKMNIQAAITAVILLCGAIVVFETLRQRNRFKKLFCNAFFGILTLILLSNFGQRLRIYCEIDAFSVALSTLFGIPGAFFAALFKLV